MLEDHLYNLKEGIKWLIQSHKAWWGKILLSLGLGHQKLQRTQDVSWWNTLGLVSYTDVGFIWFLLVNISECISKRKGFLKYYNDNAIIIPKILNVQILDLEAEFKVKLIKFAGPLKYGVTFLGYIFLICELRVIVIALGFEF